MFQRVYNQILGYAEHPYAMWILGVIAFIESSISPIPPDVLLIPMMISNRQKAIQIAIVCIVTSVIGGILGYWIGYSLYDVVGHYLVTEEALNSYQEKFNQWGFLLISIKGFLPIPYKIVAIASGLAHYNFGLFMIASTIARSSRFFMLAGLIYYFGEPIKEFIERYLSYVMVGGVLLIVGTIYLAKFF
jgi:membrane protein YqaA with SNARE-associated domain